MTKTKGDVFKIYVMRPGVTFPRIEVELRPHGSRVPALQKSFGSKATTEHAWFDVRTQTEEELALEIGKAIIERSKVLKEWLKKGGNSK